MTEEQLIVNPNAITMQDNVGLDMDLLLADENLYFLLFPLCAYSHRKLVPSTSLTDFSNPQDSISQERVT